MGPAVQSIVSLTSSLVVKILTVIVRTISNSQVFLLKKCEELLQMQKLLTFFRKNISIHVYAIFNDQSFNNTLTNDIISFEQLGPGQTDLSTKTVQANFKLSDPGLHCLPFRQHLLHTALSNQMTLFQNLA